MVQDRANGPDGIKLRHHFCAVARMEVVLRITKELVSEFTDRERVPFLDESIAAAFLSLDQSLVHSSRLALIFSEVLGRQCRYHALPTSHCMTEIDRFTEEPTVRIHENAPFQPGSSPYYQYSATLSAFSAISVVDGLGFGAHFYAPSSNTSSLVGFCHCQHEHYISCQIVGAATTT